MKKIVRALSCVIAPFVLLCGLFTGCKKGKDIEIPKEKNGIMLDKDVEPAAAAAYKQYTASALAAYKEVAAQHTDADGEVDFSDESVVAAATEAAAKLYAYACYNERTLDKYVFFGDQEGTTDLGGSSKGTARRQEYYLRINENEDTCGYRYHYTIKKVIEATGTIKTFKSKFESARIRVTDETSLLYRFEGDNIVFGAEDENLGVQLLECDWETGSDWGKSDIEMVKGDFIEPENIRADIEEYAGEDNITIRGNINILADNIVKFANISEEEDGTIDVLMVIDTDVANNDAASLAMLRKANGSDNCKWIAGDESEGFADDTGLRIVFRLWGNGLFRSYSIIERWNGSIVIFNGTAESQTTVYYSYTDRDCDMTAKLEMLEAAKAAVDG